MNRTRITRPRAFTLVEVLTVIVIIGMLLGLLFPAVNAARLRAKVTRMRTEMTQLEQAIEEARVKLGSGEYPPDGTDWADLTRFCRRAFPRTQWWDQYGGSTQPAGSVPYPMVTPDTALLFWTCGIRDPGSGAFIGFSANPQDPFDSTALSSGGSVSPTRIGPFFDPDKTRVHAVMAPVPTTFYRLVNGTPTITTVNGTEQIVNAASAGSSISGPGYPLTGNGTSRVTNANAQYYPQNDQTVLDPGSMSYAPYLYFKAVGNKYSTTKTAAANPPTNATEYYHYWTQPTMQTLSSAQLIVPFKDATTAISTGYVANGIPARGWMKPTAFQLLCPGLDGLYAQTLSNKLIDPTAAASETADGNGIFAPIYPDGLNYSKNTQDDMTNFATGMMKSDMP